ncbi:MAG: glycosyltransferase family 39 protein [Thermodesulfobacteriota bacterium]
MSREGKYLLIAILVTLATRVAFLGLTALLPINSRYHANDSIQYVALAQELAATGNFIRPDLPGEIDQRNRTYELVRTPGYPVLLMPGILLRHVYGVTIAMQTMVSAGTAYFIFRIAMMLFSQAPIALAAALLFAIDPMSIFFNRYLLTETWFTFLLTVFLYCLLRYLRQRSSKNLLTAAVLVAAAVFVRPAAYFLPAAVCLGLLVFGFLHREERRKVVLQTLAFFLLSMSPLVAWQARNWALTGYSGFSAIADINLYFYNAGAVLAMKTGVPYDEVQERLGLWNLKDYFKNFPEQSRWSDAQRFHFLWRSALRIFAAHPLLLVKATIQGMLRFLFDPGGTKYVKLFRGESDQIRFYAYVVNHGYLKTILLLFQERPFVFWGNLIPAILLLGYYFLAAIGLFRNPPGAWEGLTLMGVALYFLLVSAGPADGPRFRVVVVPIICLFAGSGWVWLSRWWFPDVKKC